jgi:hypothetical protein
MFIRDKKLSTARKAIPIILTALVVWGIILGASATQGQADEQAQKLTEESIRRAAVQCYALEGIYPVNIEYLKDHYGIRPDTKRFIIHYQFIADNLLPDISVIPIVR